jgi:hypothetical protein
MVDECKSIDNSELLGKYITDDMKIPYDDYASYDNIVKTKNKFLKMSSKNYSLKVLQAFVEHNPQLDLNVVDKYGSTFIHKCKHLKKLRYILDFDVDVNIRNNTGNTALNLTNCYDKVSLLIEYGADVNIPSYDGVTLIYKSMCTLDITELLLKNDAIVNNDEYILNMLTSPRRVYLLLMYRYTMLGIVNILVKIPDRIIGLDDEFFMAKLTNTLSNKSEIVLKFSLYQKYFLLSINKTTNHRLFNNKYLLKHVIKFI